MRSMRHRGTQRRFAGTVSAVACRLELAIWSANALPTAIGSPP